MNDNSKPPVPTNPNEIADALERMEPAYVKDRLIGLLRWQAKTGRRIVHFGWYAKCLIYHWRKDNGFARSGRSAPMSESVKAAIRAAMEEKDG